MRRSSDRKTLASAGLAVNLHESEGCPSSVGHLVDDIPRLTQAHVRSFIWPILLFRGAVKSHEVVHAISPLCSISDIKDSVWDPILLDYSEEPRLESLVNEVLGEMTAEGLLSYREDLDIWVLSLGENRRNVSKIIGVVCSLNAAMPNHILLDLGISEHKKYG